LHGGPQVGKLYRMRILVVGAGSTGGYFGGRLAQAGRDVTFLVRPARAARLAASGLQIISEHGNLTLRPKLLTADELSTHFDLILLSVKAFALDTAIGDFAPAVGPDTLILPVLNGLRHIDVLTERFGSGAVLGGVCVVSTTLDEHGSVVQLTAMQELTYGALEKSTRQQERLAAVDEELQRAMFDARSTGSIVPAMWQKWMMLASAGVMNVLMRGSIGEIVDAPEGLDFAQRLGRETAAVAEAAGHPLSDAGRQFISQMLTTSGSAFTTSMYRDLIAGRRTEFDAIVADLARRATEFGVATPLVQLALTNLWVYENRRAAAPPS